jgi:hypothetical protein
MQIRAGCAVINEGTFHMKPNDHAVHFAGTTLGNQRHICALFYTGEQEQRVLLPFIKEGLERGEKAFHIVDPDLRDQHLASLQAAGIDTFAEEHDGQLEVRGWEETYLRDGRFDKNCVIAMIEQALQSGHNDGCRQTRVVAHMEWALSGMPGVNDLVEYEARLNHVLPRFSDPVVCVYDCTKFGSGVVMDIVRTHPLVIVGGLLQENPFFVPPDQFLRELRERRPYRRNVA